jgi:carbon starvation protein CstA
VGFFVNDIAPWLSHRITIAFFSFMYPNSFMSFVIHMASLVLAMYSASVVDKAIVGCRLLLQEMAPPPIMNTNHVVDLLS